MKTTDTGSPQWTKATIEFTAGVLKGVTIEEWICSDLATIGRKVKACVGSSVYVVRAVGPSVNTYERPRGKA